MDTENHSRRNALALMAGAVPALAATSTVVAAAEGPSREFLQAKAAFWSWWDLASPKWPTGPNWPSDTSVYDAYEARVGEALDTFIGTLDDLIALPPSQRKLSELLALAVIEARADSPPDWLAGATAIVAALQTLHALGEVA